MNTVIPVNMYGTADTAAAPAVNRQSGFGDLLASGIGAMEGQADAAADALAAYAVGDNISPHELMVSMEQARLSVQLAVEVRNRLVEAYQELSRMQI